MTRGDRVLVIAGLAACAFALAALAILVAQRGIGRNFASYDLSAYIDAARRLRDGLPLYPQLAGGGYELGEVNLYLYPPPVAALFLPALLLPFAVASALWGALLTAIAGGVAIALARTVPPARRPLAAALVIGALPLQWELANGNITLVTLALALAAWAWLPRRRTAVPLALAMGLKLLAAPVALAVAVAGAWRVLRWTAVVLAAVLVATWPFLAAAWLDWVRLGAQLAAGPQTRSYNVVPELLRAGPGRALLLAGAPAAIAALGWLVRRRRLTPAAGFGAALAAAPYCSAFVFYPYATLALPVLVRLALGVPSRAATVAGWTAWLLIEVQALDPDTRVPSALLGTLIAVGATIAVATRERAPSARLTGSSP